MTPIETVAAGADAAANPSHKPNQKFFRVSGMHKLQLFKKSVPLVFNLGGKCGKKIQKIVLSLRQKFLGLSKG